MFYVMAALGYVQALRKSTKHGRTRALPNSMENTQEMDRKKKHINWTGLTGSCLGNLKAGIFSTLTPTPNPRRVLRSL